MVISFLLWSIRLSSSLVLFKNGYEYLTMGTVQVCIPFISSLLYSFVWCSFLVLFGYFKFFFLSSLLVWWDQIPLFSSICKFFSPCVLIFSWFSSSIHFVMCRFPLFINCMSHFSVLNFIWIYILTAIIWVFNSFSFFGSLILCTLDGWSFLLI